MAIFPGSAIPSAVSDDYEIDNSLRFNDGDSPFLYEVIGSAATSDLIWTLSFWCKLGTGIGSSYRRIAACKKSGSTINFEAGFKDDDTFEFRYFDDTDTGYGIITTQVFRDVSAWYNFTLVFNAPDSTSTDRMQIWVNGERVTALSTTGSGYPPTDKSCGYSSNGFTRMFGGSVNNVATPTVQYPFDGYLAEAYFIDGTAYTASDFGELDSDTNQWKPLDSDDVKDAVTFGTNGFYQKYSSTELADSFEGLKGTGGLRLTSAVTADVLIVAGGGGGGSASSAPPHSAGGGGGGGLLYETGISLNIGSYSVTVGAGGGYGYQPASGGNGGDSILSESTWGTATAIGGGCGRGLNAPTGDNSINGGSGGGGYYTGGAGTGGTATQAASNGIDGFGYNGGTGDGTPGGGGGAGSAGGAGSTGTGKSIDIRTGVAATYAAGGHYGTGTADGTAGGANTGTGGGGGGGESHGGAGGSGIVVIRYIADSAQGTGGTITSYTDSGNTYQVHTFLASSFASHTITANGDATNQRPQPHDVTANGHAHLVGPKVGSSVITLDTDDYLTVADSTDFDFGTGAFTLECWVHLSNVVDTSSNDARNVFRFESSGGSGWEWVFAIGYHSAWGAGFRMNIWDGTDTTNYASDQCDQLNNYGWHHFQWVRSGSTLYFFGDGQLVSSRSYSNDIQPTTDPTIGRNTSSVLGYVDEIRWSNVARNTASFTPDTTPYDSDSDTVLLVHAPATDGSTSFDDSSSSDHTVTAGGDTRSFIPKVGAGAMAFDGSDMFESPNAPWSQIGGGDFTMECWAKFNSLPSSGVGADPAIFCSSNDSFHFKIGYHSGTHRLEFGTRSTDPFTHFYGTETAITTNQWYHLAVSRTGSGSTNLKLYVDGVDQNATTQQGSWDYDISCSRFFVGGDETSSSSGNYVDGYLDGCRVSRVNRYTSGGFTLPTTAFTDDIQTALLLNADINQGTWNPDSSTGLAISTDSRMKFAANGDYLSLADSSDWDVGTGDFTIEAWTNFANSGADNNYDNIFKQGGSFQFARHQSTNKLYMFTGSNSGSESTGTLTDGKWNHVAVCRDSGTIYAYVNGVTVFNYSDSTDLDYSDAVQIGSNDGSAEWYIDEVRFSNSARYPSGTTFTLKTRGEPFTADANTKLLIHSDYTGGLGADSSGNYNNFTATNLVATDQMIDTPTNSFATLNPLSTQTTTLSEGNLRKSTDAAESSSSTIGVNSGKWYWEVYPATTNFGIGVVNNTEIRMAAESNTSTVAVIYSDNTQYTPNSSQVSDTLESATAGDIYGIALDVDAETLDIYQNGTKRFEADTFTIDGPFFPSIDRGTGTTNNITINFGQDSSFAGSVTAQGNQDGNSKGDFYYEPPSGYLALCTDNLPTPEIKLPGKNFTPMKYVGTGSSTTFSGVGFQPDMTWLKSRDQTESWLQADSVRGGGENLQSNSTGEEYTDSNRFTDFTSDGFTLGSYDGINESGDNLISYNWKAGGAPTADNSAGAGATPTAGSVKIDGSNLGSALSGSIAATRLSANTEAGFSIVTYTGNLTSGATVAHGLSQAPDLVIVKVRDAVRNWLIGSDSLTGTSWEKYLYFTSAVEGDDSSMWNDTAPTSSVFTLGNNTDINGSGDTYVAYCFHSVEGYSKIGTYVNIAGSATSDDLNFIYTGFKPAWFMNKMISGPDGAGSYFLYDGTRNPYNLTGTYLVPDHNYADEVASQGWDFVSNGLKLRASFSANTHIYMAFAESPFKYSNAR